MLGNVLYPESNQDQQKWTNLSVDCVLVQLLSVMWVLFSWRPDFMYAWMNVEETIKKGKAFAHALSSRPSAAAQVSNCLNFCLGKKWLTHVCPRKYQSWSLREKKDLFSELIVWFCFWFFLGNGGFSDGPWKHRSFRFHFREGETDQSERAAASRVLGAAVWTAGAARRIWALMLGIKTLNQISLWSSQPYSEI